MRRIAGIDTGGRKEAPEGLRKFAAGMWKALLAGDFAPESLTCEIRAGGKRPAGGMALQDGKGWLVAKGLGPKDDLALSVFRGMLDVCLRDSGEAKAGEEGLTVELTAGTGGERDGNGGRSEPVGTGETAGTAYLPQIPKFDFSRIVLPEGLREDIDRAIAAIRHRDLIYREWGFSKVDPSAKAILNFYGPPGTGKTMTAHAIAAALGCKILVMNYADIESKYVGDAPKNLKRAFETAERENAVLFFDEADSFLGKRITAVSSSSDQAVNSLRSQMFIFLENFDGVAVFCTNLAKNYDRAFESRITAHLKFEMPDERQRSEIFRKSIPEEVPFDGGTRPTEEDFAALGRESEGLSGRDIRNAVLWALTGAAAAGRLTLGIGDFSESVKRVREQKERLARESGKLPPDAQRAVERQIRDKLAAGEYRPVETPEEAAAASGEETLRTEPPNNGI